MDSISELMNMHNCERKRSNLGTGARTPILDCFVASLLAMMSCDEREYQPETAAN
jgi:hypothetical protein